MIEGTIFNKETGRITMTVIAPDQHGVEMQIIGRESELGILLGEQVNGQDYYIIADTPVDRPEMELSEEGSVYIGVGETLRIDNIPEGTQVVHPSGIDIVDDGYIEWAATEPGSYFFKFANFPYKEVEVNAVVG